MALSILSTVIILLLMDMRKNSFKIIWVFFCISLNFFKNLNAATTSPSQTVPKVLEEIEKEKIKKNDGKELFNDLENIKKNKVKQEQITVVVDSLVIIAPNELQNIINFEIYRGTIDYDIYDAHLNFEMNNKLFKRVSNYIN